MSDQLEIFYTNRSACDLQVCVHSADRVYLCEEHQIGVGPGSIRLTLPEIAADTMLDFTVTESDCVFVVDYFIFDNFFRSDFFAMTGSNCYSADTDLVPVNDNNTLWFKGSLRYCLPSSADSAIWSMYDLSEILPYNYDVDKNYTNLKINSIRQELNKVKF